MTRDKRVKDLTAAVQRFRRRVLSLLSARGDAYFSLCEGTPETKARGREVARIEELVKEMR